MNRDGVLGEWNRAARTLSATELPVREGYPEDAIARAYFAILHAAKAALSVHDILAESHSSVRGMFGKHLILTGAIEAARGQPGRPDSGRLRRGDFLFGCGS